MYIFIANSIQNINKHRSLFVPYRSEIASFFDTSHELLKI